MRVRLSDVLSRRFTTALNALTLAALATLGPAQAAEWPTKPVTIIQSFAPGASADIILRGVANALTEKLGQPFTIEYRTGAGGAIASQYVAKAAPDGYTLLFTTIGPMVLNPLLMKSVGYDTDRDFTPVVMLGELPQVIVSSPQLGFRTLKDLVDYGRQNPGKLNIGHAGVGSMGHLTAALFLARTGIKAAFVSYRGAVPQVMDVLSGTIQAGFPIYVPQVANVTVLAATSEQRLSFLPNTPTARESGVDVVASAWFGIFAPAGLPPDIVTKLNGAINEFIASPEGIQQFTTGGMRPLGGTAKRLAEAIARDRALWGPVIATENIKTDPN